MIAQVEKCDQNFRSVEDLLSAGDLHGLEAVFSAALDR